MQRRLSIALVATALVSIVLVGFGVLAMAQLTARNNAEADVTRALNLVSGLPDRSGRAPRQLEDLVLVSRRDVGLARLDLVHVADDGELTLARTGRRLGGRAAAPPDVSLDAAQVDAIDKGETVLLSTGGLVVGLRSAPFLVRNETGEIRVALLAGQEVTAVSRRTLAWFILSSLIVVTGASVAGVWLAKRLTGPLKAIETATSAIAAGDLAARVETSGDDEVAELGAAVNHMAADLERSKALDRQFLMSVSHDLRTPLTAITGYAEALRDGAATDPRAAGEVIGNQAGRLDRLVGDLLDLAKLDANRFRLNLRSFDLPVVTGRTVAGLATRAAGHGITLTRTGPGALAIVADPDRTAQAIGNLIDNAIKFARSQIVVEVTTSGDWAIVSVRDDGPGIPEVDLPHVFDRLYTGAHQPARAENPSGLGLAIVRELVGAMGGHVAAANNDTGGASLSLALPLDRRPASGQTAATVRPSAAPPPGPGDRSRPPASAEASPERPPIA